jgi:hypothetical protein
MNNEIAEPWKRSAFVVLLGMALLIVGILSFNNICYGDRKVQKTAIIIQTIKTGIELEIAQRGAGPVLDFDGLCTAFTRTTALTELKLLKAVDEQRKCFLDAWGHPLSITVGESNSVVIVSPGKDGIMGNRDDIR